jgi:ATP-binding cassette subfamily C protein
VRLIRTFVEHYPWQSIMLVVILLAAGIADGVGLSALLPLLNVALHPGGGAEAEGFELQVRETLTALGIDPTLGILLTVLVVAVLLKNLFVLFAETRIGYIAADVTTNLRMDLLRAIMRSGWDYFTNQSTGRLANSIATEAYRASNAYIYAVRVVAIGIEVIVYATFALLVSWIATGISLIAGALILVLSHELVRVARRAGVRQTQLYRSLLGKLTDTLQSVKTFKAMGRDEMAEDTMAVETHKLRKALKREVLGKASLEAAQEPMYAVVIAFGIFVALVQFGVEAATVTFMVLVLARLLKETGSLQKQYQKMMTAESAFWAIRQAIDEADAAAEEPGGGIAPDIGEGIRLERVGFTRGEHVILRDMSIEIPAGQLTCLVGESGVGKTTLADLIVGLVHPDEGQVYIGNAKLGELDRSAWRKQIGYVPQENLLLHDSILDNITLGDHTLTEADAIWALEAVGASEFVRRLPDDIHTVVGERGTRFSGGQRQRIMIARALAHHPKLLILDEATSALDPETEANICAKLAELRGTLTILAISHQTTMMGMADRVYRLQGGKAILEGAHAREQRA